MARYTARLAAVALATLAPLSVTAAQGLTAIRAGRLVDVERGEVRRDQVVLVRSGRIDAILPASAKVPSGTRLLDLSRYTILPGLIDCHTHLVGDAAGADVLLPLERSEAQEAAWDAKPNWSSPWGVPRDPEAELSAGPAAALPELVPALPYQARSSSRRALSVEEVSCSRFASSLPLSPWRRVRWAAAYSLPGSPPLPDPRSRSRSRTTAGAISRSIC